MLGTVVLALCYQPGRNVGNTHRGFRTVNVLTTRTGGAINVDTQIRWVDFDVDIVLHFRVDKRGTERGVTATAGVERAFTHQAVNAGFRTQPAVGVIANDFDGDRFQACHFTFRLFDDLGLEAAGFSPTQVHTGQHACPVLCFCTAGTCLNIQVAVGAVVFTGEHTTEFQLCQLLFQTVEFCYGFVEGLFVVGFNGQFQQPGNVIQTL